MFGQQVSTPFVGEIADELFPKIKSLGSGFDDSFVGTARAILAPRMGGYDGTVTINGFWDINANADSALSIVDEVMVDKRDALVIVAFETAGDYSPLDDTVAKITAKYPGFQQDMKVRSFFAQFNPKVDCTALLDMENHNALILVGGTPHQIRVYHAIQSAIPRFFPWFFTESKATPAERELLLSLCNRSPHTQVVRGEDGAPDTEKPGYIDLMEKFSEVYDFRSAKIARLIPKLMENAGKIELDGFKRDMERVDRDLSNYEDAIRNLLKQRHDLEIRIAGLVALSGKGDDGGLTDWFMSAKGVEVRNASDGSVTFEVYTTLEEWEEEWVDAYIENKNSDMYIKTCGMTKDRWEILMKGIWKNHDIKIRTCAAYQMTLGSGIEGISRYSFSKDTNTRIPNSHIQYHGCTGGFRPKMREAVQRGDYVYAMEIATLSARSIGFNDISFGEFIKDMSDNKEKRFLEDKDGNLYTPSEAVKYLKKLYKEDGKE